MTGLERSRLTASNHRPLPLDQVPGALDAQVLLDETPDGVCVTTRYFGAGGVLIRQDQNFVINSDKFQLFTSNGM
jgi:hypothetical protein